MGLILSDKQEVEIGKKVKVFICSTVGSRVGELPSINCTHIRHIRQNY